MQLALFVVKMLQTQQVFFQADASHFSVER